MIREYDRKLTLRQRLSLLAILPVVITVVSLVAVQWTQARKSGIDHLTDRNLAILSRMQAARSYVATHFDLDTKIAEVKEKYPDGKLPEALRRQLMAYVPVAASWNIGQMRSRTENFEFRIASPTPRNPTNKANEQELQLMKQFSSGRDTIVSFFDEPSNKVWSVRPVYVDGKQNCLLCHGHPDTSPWGNGRDVLGYPMEDFKPGDLRALFIVKADYAEVQADMEKQVKTELTIAFTLLLLMLMLGVYSARRIFGYVGGEPQEVDNLMNELAHGNLAMNLQQTKRAEGIYQSAVYLQSRLTSIVSEIFSGSRYITTAAAEINATAQVLAEGAANQANASQLVFNELQALVSIIEHNASLAQQASVLALKTNEEMLHLGDSTNRSMAAFQEMRSKVALINEIVYKTNILALNASIEASRAGVAGKSFAVVAQEVQRLAQLTKSAADEILAITNLTFELTTEAKRALDTTSAKVLETNQLTLEIESSSQRQRQGTTEIEYNMNVLNEIAQHNSATSEEMAATAEEFSAQAEHFSALLSYFKLAKK